MNRPAFENRLKGAQDAGITLTFELSEFNTTVAADSAFATYIETAPNGQRYYAGLFFLRADGLFTMPIPEE